MKQVLVTGGTGFIGSNLCRSLIERGERVVCVDNNSTGSERNIASFRQRPNFVFREFDVTMPLPEDIGSIDVVYHLASPASPVQYQKHPIETLLVNTIGTKYLLDFARKHNARFLFASTSEVYGDPAVHPQPETYWGHVNSIGPRSCYDEGKRAGEAFVYSYCEKFNIDARIVRLFNTYGPNMEINDGRVISNFIVQALKNEPITIYGDGMQTRSFCYILDIIAGLTLLMEKPDMKGEVVNLGNPDERTILEIAEKVKSMTVSSSPIVYKQLPIDDPKKRCPDITKARNLLGWTPRINLNTGLQETIAYFRSVV